MLDFITGAVQTMGAPGVALFMLLENVFPPIPSELIMPLAGFVASHGGMSFWLAVAAGSVGSLAGAVAWYVVGRRVGERRLREWADRHGRWLTVSGADVDRAAEWFERHGAFAVFVGRLVPGVRTFISLPAGFAAMSIAPFVLWSAAGTVVWTTALAFAGRILRSEYARVGHVLEPASWVVLGAIVVLYAVRVARWRKGR